MKAVGYRKAGSADELMDCEVEEPTIRSRDLLVEVKAVSLNPVDIKVRALSTFGPEDGQMKVIGYDAAGIVIEIGSEVSQFNVGDEVFYAGDLTRPGTNSEFHAVDERIVGKKPESLCFAESAALPLTSITAWEILFDSYGLQEGEGIGESVLIIGGAGGVGSILIQLAKKLTGLTVIATASRPDTTAWVKKMGADHVINHREPLADQIKTLGLQPKYVASLNGSDEHFPAIVELIKPRGHIAMIDDPESIDITMIKPKALSFSFEFMFTRSMFKTEDIEKQHELLNRVSELVDNNTLVSTATSNLGRISASTLQEAHAKQESGTVIGKNVLYGFGSCTKH